jgi:hypothetical protein
MRLQTFVKQNRFRESGKLYADEVGLSDGQLWAKAKHKKQVEHLRDVAEIIQHLPGPMLGSHTAYWEGTSEDGGRIGEWWTVIDYDGSPAP